MLFNSAVFLVFFTIVYSLYLRLSRHAQNNLLLVASYIFYGCWDARFLILLFVSSSIDYFCGLKIYNASIPQRKKFFLCLSLTSNLVILGFFKYFNFFVESFQFILNYFGLTPDIRLLHIVLPVGISFYTFQAMSYAIDIYRGLLRPTKNYGDFLLMVSFFPHLVAGPIQRAVNFLPQFAASRQLTPEKIIEGTWLFLYGLFQKAFVADNLAKIADPVYTHLPENGAVVLIGTYAYAFQIYCDFAGYSNMARGLAKLMGFEFMINFQTPYFSTSPREFWRRWHISLSTWLRDYLYISLGGNRKGEARTYFNLFLTMLLGGLWHGASWHFVLWGAYHGLLLAGQRFYEGMILRRRKSLTPSHPPPGPSAFAWHILSKGAGIFLFFHLICVGWVFFRAQNLDQILQMFNALVTNFHWTDQTASFFLKLMFFAFPALLFDIAEYRKGDPCFVLRWNWIVQGVVYFLMYYGLMIYGLQGGERFVYFQF